MIDTLIIPNSMNTCVKLINESKEGENYLILKMFKRTYDPHWPKFSDSLRQALANIDNYI